MDRVKKVKKENRITMRFSDVFNMVGAARFELTASCTRNKRATKLRHAPTFCCRQSLRRSAMHFCPAKTFPAQQQK